MKNDYSANGGPAFPSQFYDGPDDERGMRLRDYFAAAALQGLLANRTFQLWQYDGAEMSADLAARNAYELADAMLKARAAETKKEGE